MKHKMVKRIMSGVLTAAMVLSAFTVSPTTTTNAAEAVQLKEDTEYIIVSKKSGKAIAVENDSTSNNAKIVQKSVNTDSTSQIWTLDSDGKGYYQLINKKSGKVLDVPNSSTKEGTEIIQWNKGNGDNQKWKISDVGSGYYRITPKLSSKFGLNVNENSTKDNAKIIQWNYGNGSDNSKWEIREVKANTLGKVIYRQEGELWSSSYWEPYYREVKGASGGRVAGDLQSKQATRYDFYVGKSGTYIMRIYYLCNSSRTLYVNVANGEEYKVPCKSTGGKDIVSKEPAELKLYLEKGYCQIYLGGDDNNFGPDVDYFEIREMNYEISSDTGADRTVPFYGNAGGSMRDDGLMGDLTDEATWDQFYWSNGAGKATLRIFYASDSTRTFKVVLEDHWSTKSNNSKTYNVNCPSTGGWGIDNVGYVDVEVNMPSDNTDYYIYFSGKDGNYAPNLLGYSVYGTKKAKDPDRSVPFYGNDGGNMRDDGLIGDLKNDATWDQFYWGNGTGKATLRIYYASGSTRTFKVVLEDHWSTKSNNSKTYNVDCPSTGGWGIDNIGYVDVEVDMPSNNTDYYIYFSGKDGNYAPNLLGYSVY